MPFLFPDLNIIIHAEWLWEAGGTKNFINMKRIIITFIAAIAFGVSAMAQDSRVATLQHGTNIIAYYGPDALSEAHKGAVDGDVITLSAGEFNGFSITKAITIRGAGINKTVITGSSSVTFTIPHESAYSLKLEGLSMNVGGNSISFNGTDGTEMVVISKCYLGGYYGINFSKCNAVVVQSQLDAWGGGDYGATAKTNSNVTCINSKLRDMDYSDSGKFDVQNCVIIQSPNVKYSSIKNSIICGVCSIGDTNTTSHCLVKEGSSGFNDSWYITVTAPEPGPWDDPVSVVLWNDLFTGNYHLTAEASQTYVGTNGSEVGIYGGTYPYDTTPDYPMVRTLDVMGTHKDGKLNVQINVE